MRRVWGFAAWTVMWRASAALVVGILFTPSTAVAQAPPDWTMKIKLGKPLFITLKSGDRIEGTAGQISSDGIVVATPVGVQTAAFGDIRRVQRRDSLWNGVWIGAAVGAGLGVAAALDDSTCPDKTPGCRSEAAVIPLGGAMYGALIGWGIDALVKGRTTLFEAGGTSTLAALRLRRGGVSANLTITW